MQKVNKQTMLIGVLILGLISFMTMFWFAKTMGLFEIVDPLIKKLTGKNNISGKATAWFVAIIAAAILNVILGLIFLCQLFL
jgi:hypothetical protein